MSAALTQIREARGLTQSDLAARSGVSVSTISRFESAARAMRRTTARDVLEALEQVAPLTPAELADYCAATGLERIAESARQAAATVEETLRRARGSKPPDEVVAIANLLRVLSAEEARLLRWLLDLLAVTNVAKVEAAIRGIGSLLDVEFAPDPSPELVVWHKPVQVEPGIIEQQVVHYSRKPDQREQEGRKAGGER